MGEVTRSRLPPEKTWPHEVEGLAGKGEPQEGVVPVFPAWTPRCKHNTVPEKP